MKHVTTQTFILNGEDIRDAIGGYIEDTYRTVDLGMPVNEKLEIRIISDESMKVSWEREEEVL